MRSTDNMRRPSSYHCSYSSSSTGPTRLVMRGILEKDAAHAMAALYGLLCFTHLSLQH